MVATRKDYQGPHQELSKKRKTPNPVPRQVGAQGKKQDLLELEKSSEVMTDVVGHRRGSLQNQEEQRASSGSLRRESVRSDQPTRDISTILHAEEPLRRGGSNKGYASAGSTSPASPGIQEQRSVFRPRQAAVEDEIQREESPLRTGGHTAVHGAKGGKGIGRMQDNSSPTSSVQIIRTTGSCTKRQSMRWEHLPPSSSFSSDHYSSKDPEHG